MSDEFKKKLEAIANRVEVAKQKGPAGAPESAESKAAHVVKVNAVIADWKRRIAPLVVKAVNDANPEIAAAGIRLEIKEDHARVVEEDNLGHPIPPLPNITISATRPRPSAGNWAMGQRFVSAFGGDRRIAAKGKVLPNIRIGVDLDGRIKIIAANCPLAAHGPFWPEQFGEEQVEAAILEFVEAVASPAAQD